MLPQVLYALSDPFRLRIVALLDASQEEMSCGDYAFGGEMPKSTQSHHFKVLRECGVTRSTPRGTRLMVSLRREDLDARFPGLLDDVLHAYHRTMGAEETTVQTRERA